MGANGSRFTGFVTSGYWHFHSRVDSILSSELPCFIGVGWLSIAMGKQARKSGTGLSSDVGWRCERLTCVRRYIICESSFMYARVEDKESEWYCVVFYESGC